MVWGCNLSGNASPGHLLEIQIQEEGSPDGDGGISQICMYFYSRGTKPTMAPGRIGEVAGPDIELDRRTGSNSNTVVLTGGKGEIVWIETTTMADKSTSCSSGWPCAMQCVCPVTAPRITAYGYGSDVQCDNTKQAVKQAKQSKSRVPRPIIHLAGAYVRVIRIV